MPGMSLTDRDFDALRAIALGHDGDIVRSDRDDFSMYDGINPVTARGLLATQQPAAPAPAPAAPAPRPMAPPPAPIQQQGLLTSGQGYNTQLHNMLRMFLPMTQGTYGMRGYGNLFPQQQPAAGYAGRYGAPAAMQQPTQPQMPTFASRYG